MTDDLSRFLSRCQRIAVESVIWGGGSLPLHLTTYLCSEEAPLEYVSNVRAIVFRKHEVLVIHDSSGNVHILPGGRHESGESLEQALRREVSEETGWTITGIKPLGVLHYHHLAPKPLAYRYPYPDFLQLICIARAETYDLDAREVGGYELKAEFRSISELPNLGVTESQQRLVAMANQKGYSQSL